LSQEQLEWIVGEVVRRLQSSTPSAQAAVVETQLALTDRLVTTETLRDKLVGITEVTTVPGAIITPAVIDLLRERKITLLRAARHREALP
jgi:Tfp pilus assembly pilus retraction ATPase PilT